MPKKLTDHQVRRALREKGVDINRLLRDKLKAVEEQEENQMRHGETVVLTASTETEEINGPIPVDDVRCHSTGEVDPRLVEGEELSLEQRRKRHLASMIPSLGRRKRSTPRKSGGSRTSQKRTSSKLNGDTASWDDMGVVIGRKTVWEVERLLDVRTVVDGGLQTRQFHVRWEGFGSADDEWVDESNLSQRYDLYPCQKEVIAKMNSVLEKH